MLPTPQEWQIFKLKTKNFLNKYLWAPYLEIANPIGNAGLSFLGMYGMLVKLDALLLEGKISNEQYETSVILAIAFWISFCEAMSTGISRSVDTHYKTLVENAARKAEIERISQAEPVEQASPWWKRAGKAIASFPKEAAKGTMNLCVNFGKGVAEGLGRIKESFADTMKKFSSLSKKQKTVRIITIFTPLGWLGFLNHLSKGLSERTVAATIELNSLIIFSNITAGLHDMFNKVQGTAGSDKKTQENLSYAFTALTLLGALGVAVSYVPFTRRKGIENTRKLHNQISRPLSFDPFYQSTSAYVKGQAYAVMALSLHLGSATFSYFTTAKGVKILGKLIHIPVPTDSANAVGVISSVLGVITGHMTRVFSMLLSSLNPTNSRAKIKTLNFTGTVFSLGAKGTNLFNATAAASKNMLGTYEFFEPLAPTGVTIALVGATGIATATANLKFSGGDVKNRMTNWGNKLHCCGGRESTEQVLKFLQSNEPAITYVAPGDPEQRESTIDHQTIIRVASNDVTEVEPQLIVEDQDAGVPEGYEREPNSITMIMGGPQ